MRKHQKIQTRARPYLVKWPVSGGQSVYTYEDRPSALEEFADKYKKGIRVQMYKLDMPTELEVGLQTL